MLRIFAFIFLILVCNFWFLELLFGFGIRLMLVWLNKWESILLSSNSERDCVELVLCLLQIFCRICQSNHMGLEIFFFANCFKYKFNFFNSFRTVHIMYFILGEFGNCDFQGNGLFLLSRWVYMCRVFFFFFFGSIPLLFFQYLWNL